MACSRQHMPGIQVGRWMEDGRCQARDEAGCILRPSATSAATGQSLAPLLLQVKSRTGPYEVETEDQATASSSSCGDARPQPWRRPDPERTVGPCSFENGPHRADKCRRRRSARRPSGWRWASNRPSRARRSGAAGCCALLATPRIAPSSNRSCWELPRPSARPSGCSWGRPRQVVSR